ncbi:MAG TPA: hypothetical protein VM736_14545, partial [Gemmatimonadales bacterium]|nr:hypothetical protein [Gemmatimonadales bacterium]
GVLRVTFDPRIMIWNDEFTDAGRRRLGYGLTGDTVGGRYIPVIARLEQNVRTASQNVLAASGIPNFVASLGAGLLSVHQERRTYPVTAELGVTPRLAVSVMVPFIRVATRRALQLASRGANLGLNPRYTGAAAESTYKAFFTQFDSTLARLQQNIAAGQYGCAGGARCPARDSLALWQTVDSALKTAVYGVAQVNAPFLPVDSSTGGRGIDTTVARIQRDLANGFGVSGFGATFLLPHDTVNATTLTQTIYDSVLGFGYNYLPFRSSFHWGIGDVELGAKYRLVTSDHYAVALKGLVRLPTTSPHDSADDLLGVPVANREFDLEAQLTQELSAGPLWLNVAVRAGAPRRSTRVRRVAPNDAFLVPAAATATLDWTPGDYVGVDVAPLVRLARTFSAGCTVGYWTKARDHYAFQSATDSAALATRLGAPTSPSVLEPGTSERRLRLGVAATYRGPVVEGGFSIEQTVSGAARVPGVTVYRLVMRLVQKLF